MTPAWPRLARLVALGALGLVGCSSGKSAAPGCMTDDQCGDPSSWACMMGTCLPRVTERSAAVEILPRTDSMSARTGYPSVTLGAPLSLMADDQVLIQGTVTDAPDALVVLLAPSPIPGQGDIQREAVLARNMFQLGVGMSFLTMPATIWLLPSSPADGSQPPAAFQTPLDANLSLAFPTAAEMLTVRGVLHDSLDLPPGMPFTARAFAGTTVVSNVTTTDDTGAFQLVIAPAALPADANGMVSVELTATGDDLAGIRFRTLAFKVVGTGANANAAGPPRTFRLPAFVAPAPLIFTVLASDTNLPVSDATVRFHTEGIDSADGSAVHEREYRTQDSGQVEAFLIAGTATEPRNYQITIVPPPDSGYAGRCVPQHAVTIVGSGLYSSTFTLDPKVTLSGTVVGSDGTAAAIVTVTATPSPTGAGCQAPVTATPVSAPTDKNGTYMMQLDPGTYRVDVDPPMGAPWPRLTQDGDAAVWVSADTAVHDVALPPGQVVDGQVLARDGTALGAAVVKFYQVLCQDSTNCVGPTRVQPALRAQTRSDSLGAFRAVLPLP